jgi:hypothetical protein
MKRKVKQLVREDRPEKWTAGLDWFRWMTHEADDPKDVVHRCQAITQSDYDNASSVKPWSFVGFKGWASDSIRWGQRGGRVLWESSGEKAPFTLGRMEPSIGYASRIDLQITMSLSTPQLTFGSSLHKSTTQNSNSQHQNQKLRGLTTATSGLWLGTVGPRTSPNYLRIYDKGVESKLAEPGKLWRVELEAKYSHARELWRNHRDQLTDPKFCANYCASSLKRSGCSWPFGDIAKGDVELKLGSNPQTTPSRLASWISLSVRPVIPRLLTVFSVGEVLTMLGLSDVAAPTGNDNAQLATLRNDRPGRV